jgi:hypothetical protein
MKARHGNREEEEIKASPGTTPLGTTPRPHRLRNTSKIKLNNCTKVIPIVT